MKCIFLLKQAKGKQNTRNGADPTDCHKTLLGVATYHCCCCRCCVVVVVVDFVVVATLPFVEHLKSVVFLLSSLNEGLALQVCRSRYCVYPAECPLLLAVELPDVRVVCLISTMSLLLPLLLSLL